MSPWRALAGTFAIATIGAACSSTDEPVFSPTGSTTGGGACVPGVQQLCPCPGGAPDGVQVCEEDGTGFGACSCSSGSGGGNGGDAGMGGVGAAGAAGGGGEGGSSMCRPGSTQACYSGPAGTANVGLCVEGTQTCNGDGMGWGPCTGEIVPVPETCDTTGDDDCDGQSNEGGVNCACVPGSQSSCYSAQPGTENVGPCKGGIQDCNQAGTGYGPCVGEVVPQLETCSSPLDDDCDGMVNEEGQDCSCNPNEQVSCYEGPPGTENVGACKSGTQTCNGMGTGFGPCLNQILPSADTCATPADDDCSGSDVPCLAGWSKAYGSPMGSNGVSRIESDAQGNTVMVGSLSGANLGNGPQTGAAVIKYGPTGALLWSKVFTGGQFMDMTLDAAGNIIASGNYEQAMNFGGAPLPAPPPLTQAPFIVKFDAQGAHLWSKSWFPVGSTSSGISTLDVDPAGAILMGGFFQGTVDFGGGPITASNAPQPDLFIVKLDTSGAHIWTRQGTGGSYLNNVSFDPLGNVFASGAFPGSMSIGGAPVSSAGSYDIFLAKLAPDGSPLLLEAFGDAALQGGPCYNAIDGAGNVYLTGDLNGTIDFGGGPLSSAPGPMFLAKLDNATNHVWSKHGGDGMGQSGGRGIDVDAAGNLLVGGYFYGSMQIDGVPYQAASSSPDVFIARLSTAGAVVSFQQFGGIYSEFLVDVAFDPLGSRLLVGSFEGTINFGFGAHQQQGFYDGFAAKLAP